METAPAAPRKGFDFVAYLKLIRFPLVFTAIADSMTGYAIGTHGYFDWRRVGPLALTSAGLYFFGMALNDITDRKKDQESAPARPIPSGRVSLSGAYGVAIASLALGGCALAFGSNRPAPGVFILFGLASVAIILYDCVIKVPLMMGLVRAFNFLIGLEAGLSQSGWESMATRSALKDWIAWTAAIPIFVYVTALTYVSTLEDKELNRHRLAIGTAGMLLGSFLGMALLPTIDATYLSTMGPGNPNHNWLEDFTVPSSAMWVGLVLSSWIIWRASIARDKRGIMLVVRDGILGLILLDAMVYRSAIHWNNHSWYIGLLLIPAFASLALFKRLA